jgi:hypothetical protein
MSGLSGVPGQITIVPVYWAASGYAYTANYKAIVDSYLASVTADRGKATNSYAVTNQYYQTPTGQPAQHIQWSIQTTLDENDTNAFPAQGGTAGCTADPGFTACVTDAALQSELRTLLNTAPAWPIDDSHLYAVFFPSGVETCFGPGAASNTNPCSTNSYPPNNYCSYHSSSSSPYLIYSNQPFPDLTQCSNGGQSPNGDPEADAAVNLLSHEALDSMTDWAGAWVDGAGFEIADQCADVYGAPLGGVAGAQYNQVINGGRYYTSDGFSNEDYALGIGDKTAGGTLVPGCVQREETITASFSSPASVGETVAAAFDASASSDPDGSASSDPNHAAPLTYTWSWGDGQLNGGGVAPSHVYCATGTFTVTLNVTDIDGWTAVPVSHPITVVGHAPVVNSISPSSGPGTGGTAVSVKGCGFGSAPGVNFGTLPAANVFTNGDMALTAIAPAHSAGTFDITVTTSNGTSPLTPADHFSFAPFVKYFSWFDNVTAGMLNDNIHVFNPGASTANVTITLPGAPSQNLVVAAGAEAHATFPPGNIGGPVAVMSDWPVLASQRVQYYQSFNEVWAMDPAQASTTSYMSWFDKASAGMVGDNIHVLNPGSSAAAVTVSLAGTSPVSFSLAAGAETYATFPQGTIGGPVKVTSDQPVLAAQRVQYFQSFNEVLGRSLQQATTNGYFNWFDKASTGMVADNIHIFNPGTVDISVRVSGPLATTVTVPAGAEVYVTFPRGTIGGPVTVIAGNPVVLNASSPVLVWQRVQFFQSFNEVPAVDSSVQGKTTSHVMWFDNASPGMVADNIHILFVAGMQPTANVTVSMPGASPLTVTVAAGVETYVTFPPGTMGGPVTITSDQPVLAASRVEYLQSFNEVPAT